MCEPLCVGGKANGSVQATGRKSLVRMNRKIFTDELMKAY